MNLQEQIKTDSGTYPENPRSITLPPAGGKYIDDLSGIEVMRFTDEKDGRGTAAGFKNTYSVWPTLNCDNTRVWLFEYSGSYYVGNLNPTTLERVGPLEEVTPARGAFVDYETAFWSFLDRDKIFILVDCQIWSYKPSRRGMPDAYQVVADLRSQFPSGARFNQLYVSRDDNRFAAVVRSGSSGSGDYGIMVWERSSSTIKLNAPFDNINGITMDKSGRFVLLVRNDPEGQTLQRIYDVDTGTHEVLKSDANGQPDYCIGHNDCGMDFVVGGDQWRGAFTARKMSTPHDVQLAWRYAATGWINWHVSCRADNESWALVSTYGTTLTSQGEQREGPFVREVFQLGVKEPFTGQLRRLVHARSNWDQPARNYWATPRATISRDGRLVCWTSNNNGPSDSRTDLFIARIEPAPTSELPPEPQPPEPPDPNPPEPPIPSVPVVAITWPANGAGVAGLITVTATVTDSVDILEVYLMVDGLVVSGPTNEPYNFKLDTAQLANGAHRLMVRAWNISGTPGDSEEVVVTVNNAPTPQPPSTRKVPWPRKDVDKNKVLAEQWKERYRPVDVALEGNFALFQYEE